MSSDKKEKPKSEGDWKKELIKTVVIIGIITGCIFGSFGLMKVFLKTELPIVVVTSGSMEPTIYRGDLLFVKGVPPEDIVEGDHEEMTGDIIIYDSYLIWPGHEPDHDPIVHRVIGKYYNDTDDLWYFKAQGDNNHYPDPPLDVDYPIPETHILGIVTGKIPYIGYVKIFLTESGLGIPVIVILGTLLVISIVYDIIKSKKEKATKDEEEIPETFDQKNMDLGI